ncbi:MAG: DUF4173 domain-containing protein [Clostridiales bacterium]|nr:DUF4173 domain-containing protein [Clostridiales bacterium]
MNNYPYNFDPRTGQPIYQNYMQAQPVKPKATVDFTKRDYIFTITLLLVCGLSTFLGLFGGFAAGFTVTCWMMVMTVFAYLKKDAKWSLTAILSFLTALASPVAFALWESDVASKTLSFMVYITSCIIFSSCMSEGKLLDSFGGFLKMLYMAFLAPFEHMAVPFRALFRGEKKKTWLQVLIGIAVSIPVLCIIIPILMRSDLAFTGLMKLISKTLGMTIVKILFTVCMFIFLISYALVCRFRLKKDMNPHPDGAKIRIVKSPIAVTFLCVTALVYVVYMLSQLAYFFSAFRGLLPEGYSFTFAEYAKRGFFETEAIAFINLIIMAVSIAFTSRKSEKKINGPLKAVLAFIGIFSILFIITAISKMFMYISQYDLTITRLSVFVFMLVTILFVLAFTVKLFNLRIKSIRTAIICSLILLTATSIAGVSHTVAAYNTNAFLSGKRDKVDTDYLAELEEEAVPYLVKIAKSDNEKTALQAEYALNVIYERTDGLLYRTTNDGTVYIKGKYNKNWRFTVSSYIAAKALENAKIEENDYFHYNDETGQYEYNIYKLERDGKVYDAICYKGINYVSYESFTQLYDYMGDYIGVSHSQGTEKEIFEFEKDGKVNQNFIILNYPDMVGDAHELWRDVDTLDKDIWVPEAE